MAAMQPSRGPKTGCRGTYEAGLICFAQHCLLRRNACLLHNAPSLQVFHQDEQGTPGCTPTTMQVSNPGLVVGSAWHTSCHDGDLCREHVVLP
jgi:hypothetical protein